MKKFAFGANWKEYVDNALTHERLLQARQSLLAYLSEQEYRGLFIDIGCGSGIFSLAALSLGCKRVISIDVDRESIEAAQMARARFSELVPAGAQWDIRYGDILEPSAMALFVEQGDIVYSWGVLHHTGNMRQAIKNAARLTRPGGYFIIALYNRAPSSGLWLAVKRAYVHMPVFLQKLMVWFFYGYAMALFGVSYVVKRMLGRTVRLPQQRRGMSHFYNMVDWVGGYPYEYISCDDARKFVEALGFSFLKAPSHLPSEARHWWDYFTFKNTGNNELVFRKNI